VKGVIDACKDLKDKRAALVEFLEAELELERTSSTYQAGNAPFFHYIFQRRFQLEGDPAVWAASTDISSVQRALVFSVETSIHGAPGGLRVEKNGKRFEIKPRFAFMDLWDALKSMLWLDECNRQPPLPCFECHKIFRPLTAHEMKYCGHQCAHRASNREWRRKDLRKRKKALKVRTKGGTDVPRKTR
jgi:hypothetical protein